MKLRISKEQFKDAILCLMIFVPFLFPTGLQYASSLQFFYNRILFIWRILSCLTCIILFIQSKSFDKSVILFLLCLISLFVSTVYMNSSIITYMSTWGAYFCLYIGCQSFFKSKSSIFIEMLKNWLLFVAVINLLSMIIYPNGMPLDRLIIRNEDSKYTWIWGFKNNLYNLILPLILLQYTSTYIKKNKTKTISNVLVFLISILTATYSHSSTLIIGVFLLVLLVPLYNKRSIRNILTIRNTAIFGVLASILIVFFNAQNLFSWLIENILNKDLTLSSRTLLWNYAIQDIFRNPILGYGIQNSSTFGLLRYASTFSHCHNTILTILYQGGCAALITYGLFFFSITFKKENSKEFFLKYLFAIFLLIQLLFHITSSISSGGIFILLVLINNLDKIKNNDD